MKSSNCKLYSLPMGWLLSVLFLIVAFVLTEVHATDYAIVTTSDIRASSSQLSSFEAHKALRGHTVHTFDETDWSGSGLTGDPAAEAMRSFLQTAESTYDLDYLLIIGDPRSNVGPVPMKTLHPRNPAPNCNFSQDAVLSDYYYADVNGNWDLDGDGLYGEFGDVNQVGSATGDFGVGGIDREHDMIVGRIPVYGDVSQTNIFNQSIQDLDHILQKTMNYQNAQDEADIAWRKSALIAIEGANRLFYGEQLKDNLLAPNGFSDYRVYDYQGVTLPDPPDATTTSVPNVLAGWDISTPGIATWFTHGAGTGAVSVMTTTAAATLDDDSPAITWQASCFNSQPANRNNLSYRLLVNGAIATVGFTEISHGPGSEVDLTTDSHLSGIPGMGYGFISRVGVDELTVGEALMELKRDSTLYNRCWYWQNHVGANLYGDPDISLFDTHMVIPEPATLPLLSFSVLMAHRRRRS